MKTFTFRYDSKATPKALFAGIKKAAKTRAPEVAQNETASNSVSAILSTMTAGRIELFYAIAHNSPSSIYQLSQIMKRDHANVLRDVKVLEGLGLIQLVTEKEGERERMRPVALYDRIIFDFGDAKSAHFSPGSKGIAS